jgi:cell wall-associated NlpC family hydrolase
MNNTKKKPIGKMLVGISLSLSVAFSISMFATPQSVSAAVASTSIADQVIATGQQFLGVPYQFSAKAGRTDAFDCSSFTQYVFKQNGINLPRNSRQQSTVGTKVDKSQLQPGDLVFSDTNHDGVINHVSIYMGNDKLLHTYRVGIGVTISNFSGSAWDRSFVTARRVIPDNGQAAPPESQPSVQPSQPADTNMQPTYQAPTQSQKHGYHKKRSRHHYSD